MPFTPYNQTGFTPVTPEAPKEPSTYRSVLEGAGKGVQRTIQGIGTLGQKALDLTVNKIPGADAGSDIFRPGTAKYESVKQNYQPTNTAEKVGFGAETVAEFFIPGKLATRGEAAVDAISKGLPAIKGAVTRVIGKGAVQGATTGLSRLAQTGDVKESAKTGLGAGVTRSALGVVGEASRAMGIPERLYSVIFKNSKKDMMAELKSNGINALRQKDPAKYQEFVDQGIIKTRVGGQPYVNETLAEQALARGLKGSTNGMANEVVMKTLETESSLQRVLGGSKQPITLEPQYGNLLKKVAQEYEDVGFGEIADEANRLATLIKNGKGNVPAIEALKIRRFLDKLRIGRSYDVPATSLSMSQGNLKTLTDALRKKINSVPGADVLMKDYTFYIDAVEALAKHAQRTGNNQVLSLIDSILLGGGVAGSSPGVGTAIALGRKVLGAPSVRTNIAQSIKNPNLGPNLGSLVRAGGAQIPLPQKDQ